jgi:15-cis-phytoene synthase/lycopene beta-cyclase
LLFLYAVSRPFLTRLDYHKLVVLPLIALVWTTPWDNEVVRQGAWWYPRSCVAARIGYVPVEEYAFFVIQSLMTSLLTILLTRWSTPWRSTASKKRLYAASEAILLVPCLTFVAGVCGIRSRDGSGRLYYISMIGWWASLPLILLWYGTRRSLVTVSMHVRTTLPWLASITVPTIYLCLADLYALRKGTWHIAETKSLNLFVVPHLPLEEALFFLATNLILVSACLAFDRVVWQIRSNSVTLRTAPLSPTYFALDLRTVKSIWHTFLHLDEAGEIEEDLDAEATAILCRASKSFYLASKLLPWDLRSDLGCLYAFARAMDDFVDQQSSAARATASVLDDRISLLRKLVDVTFASPTDETFDAMQRAIERTVSPKSTSSQVSHMEDLRISALAVCHLRSIVPVHLWHQLLDGYAVDNATLGPRFQAFEDQAQYAQNVAGSIGEMCVRVCLARSGLLVDKSYDTPQDISMESLTVAHRTLEGSEPKLSYGALATNACRSISPATVARILRDARRMGVSLQLVNIARDVVSDARELKRCYLVLNERSRKTRDGLLAYSSVSSIGDVDERDVAAKVLDVDLLQPSIIFRHKVELLDVASAIYAASVEAIHCIPCVSAKTGLRVACAVYIAIGQAIRRDGERGCLQRSHLTLWQRCTIALVAVYW